MSMPKPLILCHYGNSYYLPYVFNCLKITNPDREVILLGDETNRWLSEETGLTHYYFKDLEYGQLLATFEKNYRLIQGKKHVNDKGSGKDWINFVFKRWFYIQNFIEDQGIDAFWHFDTDTMVLDNLSRHEAKFKNYDCTEQCNGKCMNGFIAKRKIVTDYVRKINDIFLREHYLHEQQQEFNHKNPGSAFTEMRAYMIFKEEEKVETYHLAEPCNKEVFDDNIAKIENYETEKLDDGKHVKKIYLDKFGRFYAKELDSQEYIRFVTLNMSRVEEDYFYKVLRHVTSNFDPFNTDKPKQLDGSVMSKPYPMRLRIRPFLNQLRGVKHSLFS